MFGLGMPEILLILAIALIVIGPKKLPELAKTLGRAMGEFKRSAQDFKRSIDIETTVKDSVKDINPLPSAEDLKDVIKDVNKKDDQATDADEPEVFKRSADKKTASDKPEADQSKADNASETTPDADSKQETSETPDAGFSSAGASPDNGASAKE